MKTTVKIIMAILTSALFLVASTAWAKGGETNLQRCIKGCNMAKASLLKACDKNTDPQVKNKCKTLGTKKLQEECFARCKNRK